MRCLIVKSSSINIVNIIFKGGTSHVFIATSTVNAIQAMFDAENPIFGEQGDGTMKTATSDIKHSLLEKRVNQSRRDRRTCSDITFFVPMLKIIRLPRLQSYATMLSMMCKTL